MQVGYGPVSQALALMLGRQGRRVGVVERWSAPYALPRAVCIDHEAARILHAVGLGEGLARVSQPASLYQWFNADWKELLCLDWSAGSVSGGPEVNFVHQPGLEAEMRAAVARQPSVALHLGWELMGFADHGDHVEVRLREAGGGATRMLRAGRPVGVDGANSLVREALGIGREDRGFQADWLVVDMVLRPGVKLDIPGCGRYCNPARLTAMVPGGMQDGRVCRRFRQVTPPSLRPRRLSAAPPRARVAGGRRPRPHLLRQRLAVHAPFPPSPALPNSTPPPCWTMPRDRTSCTATPSPCSPGCADADGRVAQFFQQGQRRIGHARAIGAGGRPVGILKRSGAPWSG